MVNVRSQSLIPVGGHQGRPQTHQRSWCDLLLQVDPSWMFPEDLLWCPGVERCWRDQRLCACWGQLLVSQEHYFCKNIKEWNKSEAITSSSVHVWIEENNQWSGLDSIKSLSKSIHCLISLRCWKNIKERLFPMFKLNFGAQRICFFIRKLWQIPWVLI